MTTAELQILKSLADLVEQAEHIEDHTLAFDERETFVIGWSKLLSQAATKMVRGSKEHSNPDAPWSSVPFKREINNELIDLLHYHFGDQKYGPKN